MRMVSRFTGLAAAAACVALATSGAAGQRTAGTAAGEGRACFQPRPMPVCRSFLITEFGLQYFLTRPPGGVHEQRRVLGTWEVGWMRNRSTHDAVGGSVFLSANDNAFRSGVRARYREWTSRETAVDVSPALILFQAAQDMDVRTQLGAALQVGVSVHDWIGVSTQVEAASGGVRLQTGVRLGGYPGAVTGAALPLAAFWHARHDPS